MINQTLQLEKSSTVLRRLLAERFNNVVVAAIVVDVNVVVATTLSLSMTTTSGKINFSTVLICFRVSLLMEYVSE